MRKKRWMIRDREGRGYLTRGGGWTPFRLFGQRFLTEDAAMKHWDYDCQLIDVKVWW